MERSLISTRGVDDRRVSLRDAILTSQPADKGLYVFGELPHIDATELEGMEDFSYHHLAKEVLGRFDFGLPEGVLDTVIESAYGEQWDHTDITPVSELGENTYLLELYWGPTQAFKDIALQLLPRILSAYRQPGQMLRALGASSGDTISAAHFGVGGVQGLQSCFLLPYIGPSEIQKLQATAHGFHNAITILINGSFDEGQRIIKELLTHPKYAALKDENNFTSFNSINIARILAQIVYYFYAYLELVRKGAIRSGNPVNFSVPSGNFGDALAGVYARKMGLPIEKINVATNANDVLHRFLQTGRYEPGANLTRTLAPSQDITVASNFERMIFEIVQDPVRIVALMRDLQEQGYFQVSTDELRECQKVLASSTTTDAEIEGTIIGTYRQTMRIIDPHTATGVHGSWAAFGRNPTTPTIHLATADHIKFDQPPGVPRDEVRYRRVIEPLMGNPEVFLRSDANEPSVVQAVMEATDMMNRQI